MSSLSTGGRVLLVGDTPSRRHTAAIVIVKEAGAVEPRPIELASEELDLLRSHNIVSSISRSSFECHDLRRAVDRTAGGTFIGEGT